MMIIHFWFLNILLNNIQTKTKYKDPITIIAGTISIQFADDIQHKSLFTRYKSCCSIWLRKSKLLCYRTPKRHATHLFIYLLLRCGDIHVNPGPVSNVNQGNMPTNPDPTATRHMSYANAIKTGAPNQPAHTQLTSKTQSNCRNKDLRHMKETNYKKWKRIMNYHKSKQIASSNKHIDKNLCIQQKPAPSRKALRSETNTLSEPVVANPGKSLNVTLKKITEGEWNIKRTPLKMNFKRTGDKNWKINKTSVKPKLTTNFIRAGKHWTIADSSTESKNHYNKLTLCFWNAQSINHKSGMINEYTLDNDIDIYCIAESWIKDYHTDTIAELKSIGRTYVPNPRENRTGGGTCCIHKKQLNIQPKRVDKMKTMEHMELELNIQSKIISFVIIYRPESSPKHKYSMDEFYQEFT